MKPDPGNDNLFQLNSVSQPVEALLSQPWKNGGGLTRVLASHEGWRLSVADITWDGTFSRFPGIMRHIALLKGHGVRLLLSDGTEREVVRVGEIVTFSGELGVDAVLVDGPVQVVNLMHPFSHAGRLMAVTAANDQGFDVPRGTAFLSVRGRWKFESATGQVQICREKEVLVLPDEVGGILRSEVGDDALLYLVIPD